VLADFGVPVTTIGGPAGVLGLIDLEQLDHDGPGGTVVLLQRPVLRIKPGTLGTLDVDQLITVEGKSYRVRGPAPGPNSIFERIELAESVE